MNTQLSPQSSIPVIASTPYEEDSYTWLTEQLALLHRGQFDKLDFKNLVEELESSLAGLSSSLRSHLRNVLSHMLKWEYQPELRTPDNRSWRNTIRNGRHEIATLLDDNEGLMEVYHSKLSRVYHLARLDAEDETGLPLSTFPEVCPYTEEQILSVDLKFLPGIPFKVPEPEKKRSQKGKRKR